MHQDKHLKLSLFLTTESILAGIALGLIFLGVIYISVYLHQYQNLFYPGVIIDQTDVGGMTKFQAKTLLQSNLPDLDQIITISTNDQQISSSAAQLRLYRQADKAIAAAFKVGRKKNLITNLIEIFKLQFQPKHFQTDLKFDQQQLSQMISQLALLVDDKGIEPFAELKVSGNPNTVEIFPGKIGHEVNLEQTLSLINQVTPLSQQQFSPVFSQTAWELSEAEQQQAKTTTGKLVGNKIVLKKDYQKVSVSDQELISLLTFPQGINDQRADQLFSKWGAKFNRPAQDAVFKFDPQTFAVEQFVPDKTGIQIDQKQTLDQLVQVLNQIVDQQEFPDEIEITTQDSQAQNPLSATNELGINQLVGFGESYYYHSIPSRINNVKVTADRINNTIVAPGEEFSFNDTLGEVSSKTGYQPAYVIKDGMTVLGDGGGVCQVSSTLFRALLNAGLNITRRLPHSYRVSYYELNSDPGFDATVYSGNVDLRFINDTDHHLLIHAETNSDDLYMKIEIYGTQDGRVSTISDYRKWDQRPAAATQYFDDPTLPVGQLKQIDWSASGIKAEFKWTVTKDGQILHQKTYYSNYQPWSAKYLRGTK